MAGQHIAVVGSLNMDLVLNMARIPAPGETLVGRNFATIPGGKGANQAVACARLGGKAAMIGRIGADEFGRALRAGLKQDGVAVEHVIEESDAKTGTAVVFVEDSGQNVIVIVPGANDLLQPEHIVEAGTLIDTAAAMLVQLEIPLSTVESAVERAHGANVPVILNPAPARQVPTKLWPQLDYIIPNMSEASLLTGIEVTDIQSATAAAQRLMERGVRHVLLTLGPDGVLVCDRDGVRHHAAPRVQAVDTTAAGDTFIGALAVGLSDAWDLDEAARFATAAAALSVTRPGAQSSIPFRRAVLDFASCHTRG